MGLPDVVIANAGISGGTDTGDPRDLASFRRIVDTNLVATVATFAPFVEAMKAAPPIAGGRRLVVIASVAGVRGLPGSGAYSASKAAVAIVRREPAHRTARDRHPRRDDRARLHRDADDARAIPTRCRS